MDYKIWQYTKILTQFVRALGLALGLLILVLTILHNLALAEDNPDWVSAGQLPVNEGLSRHAAVAIEDTIYVIGGGKDLEHQARDVYHSKIDNNGRLTTWNKDQQLNKTLIYAPAVVSKEGCVYMVGGRTGDEAQSSTLIGQLGPNHQIEWQEKNIAGFSARYLHTLIISGNKLYAIGGFRDPADNRVTGRVDVLNLSDNCTPADNKWTAVTQLSPARAAHASVAFNGKIYVIGGFENGDRRSNISQSVYFASIEDNEVSEWTQLSVTLPISLAYHAAVVPEAERRIYVIGGLKQNGDLSSKVYSAHIENDGRLSGDPNHPTQWLEEPELELPTPLYRHTAVLANNGSLYVIGGQTKTQNGSDVNQSQVYFTPPLALTKSSDPAGPIHETDTITYTLAYANNSFITQTMTITDVIPFNVELIPDSISDPGQVNGSTVVWNLGDVSPGESGQVSFQVKVPLFLSSKKPPETISTLATGSNVSYILPVPVTCDTTRFWANGVTQQPPLAPNIINVQIPPNTKISQMWLGMKSTDNSTPTVADQPANLLVTTRGPISASVWAADIPQSALDQGQVTVITQNPRELNAIFLFDKDDPPFAVSELEGLLATTKTFTYTFDIPSVTTQTMDVIIPFMDITYWQDNMQPDTRLTTVTVKYNGRALPSIKVNNPNLGNGLLMTQFPIDIGPLETIVSTATLEVTVDTEDSIYTLGPRICRPVYIANTAWLCSQQAGCITDTAINKPPNLKYPAELFLPIIMKSGS
ncbi:MAG: DUF11 domain-containing protein [Anaerolineae bacterium]|nr:DUF11 domain-containing protein [Anaerolineae bacterium]MCB9104542.1 DUF11 domain-containing protein [Anaerolineales bacterium]